MDQTSKSDDNHEHTRRIIYKLNISEKEIGNFKNLRKTRGLHFWHQVYQFDSERVPDVYIGSI